MSQAMGHSSLKMTMHHDAFLSAQLRPLVEEPPTPATASEVTA